MSALWFAQAKAGLRRHFLAQRALLKPREIDQMSRAIAAHVQALPAFQASQTMMAYLALPDEVQTTAILQAAQQGGKQVVVPKVTTRGLMATVCPADASQLRPGPFGILEPSETVPIAPDRIDCVLVPGLGFDYSGVRLGFGKGYYDRFLRQLPATTHYGGLAFSQQLVPRLPWMPHDVCMPFIVTERGVVSCQPVRPTTPEPTRKEEDGGMAQEQGEYR